MSDYGKPNFHQRPDERLYDGSSTGTRGLLIALGLIVLVIAGVAMLGNGGAPIDGTATPAAETPAPAAPAE